MRSERRSHSAVLLLLIVTACSEPVIPGDGSPAESEQSPMRMEAIIDGRRVAASADAGFETSGLEVNKGGIQLSVAFHGSSGDAHAPVSGSSKFRLDVLGSPAGAPLPERVEFTRYDPFSGALYWIAPGQAVQMWLGLYHVSEGHYDFGPFPITIERRSHEPDSGA